MVGGEVRVALAGTGFIGAVHARSARLAGARFRGMGPLSDQLFPSAARFTTGLLWEDSTRKLVRAWSPLALAVALIALTACNTVRGVGQDVSATGRAVSGAAARATPR